MTSPESERSDLGGPTPDPSPVLGNWRTTDQLPLTPAGLQGKQKGAPAMPGRLMNFVVQLVCRSSNWFRLCRRRLFRWKHADEAPILALVLEKHDAVDEGKEGVVLSTADVQAGLVPRAALADQDRSRVDELAAKPLYAQSLAGRIAAVY